jgi:hypothetical protein
MRLVFKNRRIVTALCIWLLSWASLSGCNVFSLVDKPSGDEQILSAARACFDSGDFDCARSYYAELSASYSDIRASEEAFLILAENGATMAAFMETFGNGGSGSALTALAERMAPGSQEKRQNILRAFKKYDQISVSENPSLRALVRFVGAVALAAEFLAEEIPTSGGTLVKSKIASGGAACPLDETCAGNGITPAASCGEPTDAALRNGNTSVDFLSADLSGTIDLGHFKQAMSEMSTALSQLSASGNFGSGAGGLSQSVNNEALGTPPAFACFRSNMLALGIGR